jgi:hypothetical protein
METKVTKVNGPVAMHILRSDNGKVTFYLFGDAHFSVGRGCDDPKTIRLTYDGERLNDESIKSHTMRTIDITAALYLILKYNNKTRIPTSMFVEEAFDKIETRTATTKQVESGGWLTDASKLRRQLNQFAPNCDIQNTDIRQNYSKKTLDILSHIATSELPNINILSDKEIVSLFKIIQIIFESYEELFDAMCIVNNVGKLQVLIDKVGDLEPTDVRDRCLNSLRVMRTSESFIVKDKSYHGHKIAKVLEELRSHNKFTALIADKNLEFIKAGYLALKEELDKSNLLTEVALGIKKYSELDEVVKSVFSVHFSSLVKTFISMASWFMDIYTITLAFISRSPVKIIFAGNAHIDRYVELLVKEHRYVHLVNEVNFLEYFDEDKEKMVHKYQRCLELDTLPDYFDFNAMKNSLYNR